MKICYLANSRSIHTQRWIKYFANRKHDVHLISFENTKSLHNVQTHSLNRTCKILQYALKPLAFLIDSIMAKRIIQKIRPNILHSHYISDYGIIGALTGFHPFILSAWGSDILVEPKKSKILEMLIKYSLKNADMITCDGDNLRDIMIQMGADPKKIKLIFHGIDITKFNVNKRDSELKRTIAGDKSPIIISCRNFRCVYNIESLIKSIPLILHEIPNAKFIIAGDGPEKSYLIDLANSLEVTEKICFVGHVPHNMLPKYLASSDIYISTSLSDGGIAVSTMEAMACGVPVIVTDAGDNKKWIRDGKNGYIIPKEDPNAIADKVVFMWNNKTIMEKFSKININLVKKRANYINEMGKMEKYYNQFIQEDK